MTVVALSGCQVAPGVLIEPIECEMPRYGLYSVADFPAAADTHMFNGVEWMPYDCSMAEAYCHGCTFPGDPKVYHQQPDMKSGLPFAVYGSFKCSGPGWSVADMEERARKNLELGEERRVEREFIHSLQNSNPLEPDTLDLTPASGAVPLVAGIAAIEDYAGEHMSCLPTIHSPRGLVATFAAASLMPTSLNDARMKTYLGSLIAAGGGYDNLGPDGTPAPAGEAWVYVTGPVHIWLDEIRDVPGAEDSASHVNIKNNDLLALAERLVVTGFECGAAAIRVKSGTPFC